MPDVKMQSKTVASDSQQQATPRSLRKRMREFSQRMWRPVASVVAVALAMLIIWHGINGKNGLLAWQQKRTEDRQLRKDIVDLQKENALLRERIERLKSDPDAIRIAAHGQMHYVKPNEVIVPLPAEPNTQAQPAGAVK
jgi:cell division protein FtsB